eukprot:7319222-Alexandrium_andersonii.AAC.1
MSAILVGSEMCIRDSAKAPSGTDSPMARWCCCSQGKMAAAAMTSLLSPVSYTHLTLPTICSV